MVAARMGSIPDVVTDEVNGLLVAPDDPAGLAAAVARLRREPGLADRLAEAGRRRVERGLRRDAGAPPAGRRDRAAHRRPSRPATNARRGRGFRMMLRRRLGASWRRLRAAVLRWRLRASPARVAGALVYHQTFRTPPSGEQIVPGITAAALERHLRHLRRSYELVPASQLHGAMLARRRGRPDPDRGHLRRRPRKPSRGGGAAPAAPRLPRHVLPDRGGARRSARVLVAAPAGGGGPRPRPTPGASRAVSVRAGAEQPLAGLAADVEQAPAAVRAAVADALSQLIGEDPPAYRLTRSQVRELARAGFEIGFHTRDHRPLPELADDELARALRGRTGRARGGHGAPVARARLSPRTRRRARRRGGPQRRLHRRLRRAGPVDHGASRSAVARPDRAAARGSQRVRAGLGLRAMGGSLASPARSRRTPRRRARGGGRARAALRPPHAAHRVGCGGAGP